MTDQYSLKTEGMQKHLWEEEWKKREEREPRLKRKRKRQTDSTEKVCWEMSLAFRQMVAQAREQRLANQAAAHAAGHPIADFNP